jgi:hypothetical protein
VSKVPKYSIQECMQKLGVCSNVSTHTHTKKKTSYKVDFKTAQAPPSQSSDSDNFIDVFFRFYEAEI